VPSGTKKVPIKVARCLTPDTKLSAVFICVRYSEGPVPQRHSPYFLPHPVFSHEYGGRQDIVECVHAYLMCEILFELYSIRPTNPTLTKSSQTHGVDGEYRDYIGYRDLLILKTTVYPCVNGDVSKTAKIIAKVILPTITHIAVNVMLSNITF